MSLFDPQTGRFIQSNDAVARLTGAPNKEALGNASPVEISPERQPDGRLSSEKAGAMAKIALARGSHRFEWLARRYDGGEQPLDIVMTAIPFGDRPLLLVVARDLSAHKQAEQEILRLNASLEQRVAERTVELVQTNEQLMTEIAERRRQEKIQRQRSDQIQKHRDVLLELARSENSLRESEEKFRALFEASSQGVILHDEEKMLEVNPACLRILGFQRADEMVGKHPADTSAPIQPNGQSAAVLARQHIQDCMTRGSTRFDWVARNSRGEDVPIEIILTRIQWGGRQLIQAVFNDIADRKRAEAELRESEARLRESEARFSAAFRASPVFISISRLSDARFVLVNEAFLNWTGYQREEVIGRTSVELVLWADPADRERFWTELRRTGSIRERECRIRNRRGTLYTMSISADIIEIDGVPHMLSVGLDITQRKQAEAELVRTLAREKELGQLRSHFVSMVSHEFRTPLGIIQSSAEILEDYFEQLAPAERKDHLQSIRNNTRRMAGVMDEALLIGRLDAGKMECTPTPVDLRSLARRLVDEALSATDRRCPIELALGELPAEAQADERLLQHIFSNLLTNAVKYSEPGQPVQFELACDGTDIVSTIRDRGIGIPEADQEWLFNAFHRGRNVGDRPGTGLGLVIVKRCVDLHGGRLKVESKPGHGTVVTVRLPKLRTEPATPESRDGSTEEPD